MSRRDRIICGYNNLPSTASSMFASSKTIKGAFPPASKDTLTIISTSAQMNHRKDIDLLLQSCWGETIEQFGNIRWPSEADFLHNLILAHFSADLWDIFECWNNIDDTIRYPGSSTELRRQSINNESIAIGWRHTSASAKEEKGVSGGGLITTVQPAARAAPSFRVIIAEGKFHGVKIDLNSKNEWPMGWLNKNRHSHNAYWLLDDYVSWTREGTRNVFWDKKMNRAQNKEARSCLPPYVRTASSATLTWDYGL